MLNEVQTDILGWELVENLARGVTVLTNTKALRDATASSVEFEYFDVN